MRVRSRLRSRGSDDPDGTYISSWALPSPRAMRKCASRRKCYVELDSDEEEDARGLDSEGDQDDNDCEDKDDDVIIDEDRSLPAKGLRAFALLEVQHTAPPLVVSQTARQEDNTSKLFKSLPLEIHQTIAAYLPKDRDVAVYARICKNASDSVTSSVWRRRFAQTFDLPDGLTPEKLAKEYMIIRGISRKWSCFDDIPLRGHVSWQLMEEQRVNRPLCLTMLRNLIINSNARKGLDTDGNEVIIGLNHDYIRKVVTRDEVQNSRDEVQFIDILDAVLNTDVNVYPERILSCDDEYLIQVIQLCLTSLSLQPDYSTELHHFDLSQEMAYANPVKQPVFKGEWKCRLNVHWVLATVNFFKFHLKRGGGEGLLADDYLDLESGQLPQPWLGRLQNETQQLGTHWKGAYTFMDHRDLISFRCRDKARGHSPSIYVDGFDPFQDISIFFDESKFSSDAWPKTFELLHPTDPYIDVLSNPSPRRALRHRLLGASEFEKRKYRLKSFYGTSRGLRPAHFYGRIHALPPQGGIPGFQRISFIKLFHQDGEFDPDSMWAYEGCVLPGNRIIVGRWWWITDAEIQNDEIFSGPFIFWNVNDSDANPPIEEKESIDFLMSLKDLGIVC